MSNTNYYVTSGSSVYGGTLYNTNTNGIFTNINNVYNYNEIKFHDESGLGVGRLYWDEEGFHFEGNLDESAAIFFNMVGHNLVEAARSAK
jgi:hypothetical protein